MTIKQEASGKVRTTIEGCNDHLDCILSFCPLCEIGELQEQVDRLEKENKELKSGIYEGIYLSACYCEEGHVCSPCQIKMQVVKTEAAKEAITAVGIAFGRDGIGRAIAVNAIKTTFNIKEEA